jgi:hypothetical protein
MIAGNGNALHNYASTPMANDLTESDVDRLEKEMAEPSTRLPAIAALADFGSMKLYQVGSVQYLDRDPKRDKLRERAANLAQKYTDIDTISLALDSRDPRLQMWGLWFWNVGIYGSMRAAGRNPLVLPVEGLTDDETKWLSLVPKIQRLAKVSPHRSQQ